MPQVSEFDIPKIALVCHEANRAYCYTLGDFSQYWWETAPEWQKQSAIDGVRWQLEKLQTGKLTSPADSHEAWTAAKKATGWTYGPVKDESKKQHPCMVSFEDLPIEQRRKDYIFSSIVRAYWFSQC